MTKHSDILDIDLEAKSSNGFSVYAIVRCYENVALYNIRENDSESIIINTDADIDILIDLLTKFKKEIENESN